MLGDYARTGELFWRFLWVANRQMIYICCFRFHRTHIAHVNSRGVRSKTFKFYILYLKVQQFPTHNPGYFLQIFFQIKLQPIDNN